MQDRIQRMLDGHESRSPAWRWLGIKLVHAEPGTTRLAMKVTEEMRNHGGVCHGGFLGTLADSAMGSAMATVLPEGERHLSFDLKLSFMRPVEIGASVEATGTVIHAGRRTATAEGKVHDEQGKLVAHATTTCLILPG